MFDRVIAGFDGFDGGRDAIVLAAGLQPRHLTIAMVYGPQTIVAPRTISRYWDLLRVDAEQRLAAVAGELGVEAELRAIPDTSAGRALHNAAQSIEADLLIIGSAHRGPLGCLLVGDAGSAVLHGAPCPVAIAPKRLQASGWRPHRIGVGYDGAEESRAALATASALAQHLDAEILVCTAWREPVSAAAAYSPDVPMIAAEVEQHAQDLLDSATVAADIPCERRLVHGRPGTVLRELSTEVDLLVVGSRDYGAARVVQLGSTAHHLVRGCQCPLVVIPRLLS